MQKTRRLLKGRIERFVLDSKVLEGNALGDPHRREVQVYLPEGYDSDHARRYPVFCDVVGFMGAGPAHTNWKAFDENVPERIERLVHEGAMGPVIAVFPDCWTRLGGNQYINSSAVGNYADYIVKEILPEVDKRYRTKGSPTQRAIFGKSSGGYGAIVHAMKYAKHWGAAACHSGDMYFDFCYRTDIPNVLNELAKSGGNPKKWLADFYAKKKTSMSDGHAIMFLAMAAFYDPDPKAPLGFRLPMDLHTGEIDETAWKRWLKHDPIHLVERKTVQENLKKIRLFIDCGFKDQYHLHYGARILSRKLKALKIKHHYEEFEDNHSSIDYRMDVSLPWLYKVLGR